MPREPYNMAAAENLEAFIRGRDAEIREAVRAMTRGDPPGPGAAHIAAIFRAGKTVYLYDNKMLGDTPMSSVALTPMAPGNARYIAALCHTMPVVVGDNIIIDPSAELADPAPSARLLGALLEISATLYISPEPVSLAFRATGHGPMSALDLPRGRSYLQSRRQITHADYQAIVAATNPFGWCNGGCNPFMCGGTHGLADGTMIIGTGMADGRRKTAVLVVRGSLRGSVWEHDMTRRIMTRLTRRFDDFVIARLCTYSGEVRMPPT